MKCDKSTAKLVYNKMTPEERARMWQKIIKKFDGQDLSYEVALKWSHWTWESLGGSNSSRVCRVIMEVYP